MGSLFNSNLLLNNITMKIIRCKEEEDILKQVIQKEEIK